MKKLTKEVHDECRAYCVEWDKCAGLPWITGWTATAKNLVLYFEEDPRKLIPLAKVFEIVNKLRRDGNEGNQR